MYPSRHYHVHKHDCTWRKFGIKCLYELPQENVLYNQQILTMKIYLEILFHLTKYRSYNDSSYQYNESLRYVCVNRHPVPKRTCIGWACVVWPSLSSRSRAHTSKPSLSSRSRVHTSSCMHEHVGPLWYSCVFAAACCCLCLNRNFWDGLLHYLYLQYLHDGGNILPLKQSTRGLREGCMLD